MKNQKLVFHQDVSEVAENPPNDFHIQRTYQICLLATLTWFGACEEVTAETQPKDQSFFGHPKHFSVD